MTKNYPQARLALESARDMLTLQDAGVAGLKYGSTPERMADHYLKEAAEYLGFRLVPISDDLEATMAAELNAHPEAQA